MKFKCYWISFKHWEDPKEAIDRFAIKNNVLIKDFRLFGRIAKIYCIDNK